MNQTLGNTLSKEVTVNGPLLYFSGICLSRQSNDSIGVNVKVKVRCVQYAISTYLFTKGRWKQGLPNAYFCSAQRNDAKKEQAESGAFSLLLGSKRDSVNFS